MTLWIKSGLDIIDLMGPDATQEDYLWLAEVVQALANDPEMFLDDDA
jgi:hypothetical protein